MIIAIDESGSFAVNSQDKNLFVAAHIQSHDVHLALKEKQFKNWEDSISSYKRDKFGEVKGQLLDKVDLKNFIKKVVFQKPEVLFSYISIIPGKNLQEVINKYKKFEVTQLELSIDNFKKANSKKFNINYLNQLSKWLNKRNEVEFLKMVCLKKCIYNGLYFTFPECVMDDRLSELLNINFKIDKDFINNENEYWKTYLLRSIQELNKLNPIPMLKDWSSNHPIREKYVVDADGFNLSESFQNNIEFLDSKKSFEIRIADIAAIIFNRYLNRGGYKSHYENMRKKMVVRGALNHLVLNDFDFDAEIEKVKKLMH